MAGSAGAFLAAMEDKLGGVPCNFDAFEPQAVFPGQDLTAVVSMFGKQIRTGAGLFQDRERVLATQAGVLRFEPPNVYWVEHGDHRYLARAEDNVIGVVTQSFAESYRVDIGGSAEAQLPTLAFDGASKRNRPVLEIGALVYARIAKVHRDMDPELTCMVANGPRKDWMTGQSVYGELKSGFVFSCSLRLAERLLEPDCPVLVALAGIVAFEIAVGSNGSVWVDAGRAGEIALVVNAIRASEDLPAESVGPMVKDLAKAAKQGR